MANENYELQQIVGLVQQQVQLLRGIKDEGALNRSGISFPGRANPFSGSYEGTNPFSAGFGKSGGGYFGVPSFAQLGGGIAKQAIETKLFGTDISRLSTNPQPSMMSSFGFFQNKTKINQEQRMMAAANFGDKMTSGLLSGGAAALNIFAGSNPLGLIGAAALNISADQMRQQNAYNKYLLQNSFRFINYNEKTNENAMSGLGLNDRMDMASYLRRFGTKTNMSDRDTQNMLKGMTEGDLLRQVKNTEELKSTMELYAKTAKQMMIATGEGIESMIGLMSDLKKMGIDPAKGNQYAAKVKSLQNLTGIDYATISSNITSIATGLTQGTNISNENALNIAGEQFYLTNAMYDKYYSASTAGDPRAKQIISMIANNGGVEQASAIVSSMQKDLLSSDQIGLSYSALAFFDWNEKSKTFEFNQSKYNQFTEGGATAETLLDAAEKKSATLSQTALANWTRNSGNLIMSQMNGGEQSQYLANFLTSFMRQSGMNDISTFLSTALGYDTNTSNMMGSYLDYMLANGSEDIKTYNNLTNQEMVLNKANSETVGMGYAMSKNWQSFKDLLGDVVSPINTFFNWAGEGIGNWWNGYDYESYNQLSKYEGLFDSKDLHGSIDALINKFNELADKSDELSKKYGEQYGSLGKLSTVLSKAANTRMHNNRALGYVYGDENATGLLNLSATAFAPTGMQGQMLTHGVLDENAATTYYEQLKDYLGIDSSYTQYGVQVKGAAKFDELLESYNNGGWNSLSEAERLNNLSLMESLVRSGSVSLESEHEFRNHFVDNNGNIVNSQIAGHNLNIIGYGNGSAQKSEHENVKYKDITKNLEKSFKEVEESQAKAYRFMRAGMQDEADKEIENSQDILKYLNEANVTGQYLKDYSGQVATALSAGGLSQDILKTYGLDSASLEKGDFSIGSIKTGISQGSKALALDWMNEVKQGGFLLSNTQSFLTAAGIDINEVSQLAKEGNLQGLEDVALRAMTGHLTGDITYDIADTTSELTNFTKALRDATDAVKESKNSGSLK